MLSRRELGNVMVRRHRTANLDTLWKEPFPASEKMPFLNHRSGQGKVEQEKQESRDATAADSTTAQGRAPMLT
jgi:hypothetical protein